MSGNKEQQAQVLYTIAEAAARLHLSRKTVEREIDRGGLDGVYRYGPGGGRIVRVTGESIDAYYTPMQSIATVNGRG